MKTPLRISIPSNSRPMQSDQVGASALIKNTSTGMAIPASQALPANSYYQTSDWFLFVGYEVASLVLWTSIGAGIEVMAVPVSAADPSQQLDGITWGPVNGGGYVRITSPLMPGVFGFYLRFIPQGGQAATLIDALELQFSY